MREFSGRKTILVCTRPVLHLEEQGKMYSIILKSYKGNSWKIPVSVLLKNCFEILDEVIKIFSVFIIVFQSPKHFLSFLQHGDYWSWYFMNFLMTRDSQQSSLQRKFRTRSPNPAWNRDFPAGTSTAPQGDLMVTSIRQNNELQVGRMTKIRLT